SHSTLKTARDCPSAETEPLPSPTAFTHRGHQLPENPQAIRSRRPITLWFENPPLNLHRARRIILLFTSHNDRQQHYLSEFKEGNNSEKNLTQKFSSATSAQRLTALKRFDACREPREFARDGALMHHALARAALHLGRRIGESLLRRILVARSDRGLDFLNEATKATLARAVHFRATLRLPIAFFSRRMIGHRPSVTKKGEARLYRWRLRRSSQRCLNCGLRFSTKAAMPSF